jgi:2-oxoglutarate ferredoxin oxidoreductase subunit gamma
MRGGKARCTVVISDEEIGSPLVRHPSAAVVLNIPSMEAFRATGQTGRLADRQPHRLHPGC